MKKILVTGTLAALALTTALPAFAQTETPASDSASASASVGTSTSSSAGPSTNMDLRMKKDAIKNLRTNTKKDVKGMKRDLKDTRKANTKATATVDSACVGAAIEKRDNAIIVALDAYYASLKSAFEVRRDALKAAWLLTDTGQRETEIKAAHMTHRGSLTKARETFKTSRESAWKTFKTDTKACRGVAGSVDASAEGADMGL